MPLLSLVASSPEAVRQLTIEQVVATAGDGRLRDGTESQRELREYLRQVAIDALATYADYCLSNAFSKGGQVLQDLVTELGRRLEYEVTNGRYQGTTNAVGFDGIWHDPSGHGLVIEVKTTDAYRLSLDTVARYRDQLLAQNVLAKPCSILIVVGRTDTGELEAQVRGSRHAWDIRLISVDALLNLVRIKESADSQETMAKIRRLLTPLEYTRLDQLVDVVFTTTQDVETAVAVETGKSLESERQEQSEASESVGEFTPMQWHTFLQEGEHGFFVHGCTDLDVAFTLPVAVISDHLAEFHTTEKQDGAGHYYHIKIIETGAEKYSLQLPRSGQTLGLAPYLIQLQRPILRGGQGYHH